ncbi:MAG: hypothetical protein U5S82_17835 [Gammaproteobacteria bacterium]|nr:hypothetical protein [Gammaproteobacteria bacterium]
MTGKRDQELAALYRVAAIEEPPAHLDRTIRDAARRATRSPLARFTPFSGRWPLALSAAAVVVMTTTLLIYQVDPDPILVDEDMVPRQETAAPAPDAVPAPPSASDAATENRRPAPANGDPPVLLREAVPPPAPASDRALPSREKEGGGTPARLMHLPRSKAMDQAHDDDAGAGGLPSGAAAELAAIRRLVETGETKVARRRLESFVERYPDYELPPELDALLRQ